MYGKDSGISTVVSFKKPTYVSNIAVLFHT